MANLIWTSKVSLHTIEIENHYYLELMTILISAGFALLLSYKLRVQTMAGICHLTLHMLMLCVLHVPYAMLYLLVMFFSAPVQLMMRKTHYFCYGFTLIPVLIAGVLSTLVFSS